MSRVVLLFLSVICTTLNAASDRITVSKDSVDVSSGGFALHIGFDQRSYRARSGSCVDDGFTVQESGFHIEYVALTQVCDWNGLPSGLYEYFFKSRMKDVQKIESYKAGDIDIVKFTKGEKEFYYISSFDVRGYIFVLDFQGSLASQVCPSCAPLYPAKRMDSAFDESIIEYNIAGNYFGRDSERGGLFPF